MAVFQTYLELLEAILVHEHLESEIPLEQQLDTVLCGTMGGDGHLRSRYTHLWYELYSSEKPVIVGHHDHLRSGQSFIYQDRVYCLDTSCVHGRPLTGLILLDFTIVSVPSRRDYWSEVRRAYAHLGRPAHPAITRPLLPKDWDDGSEHILLKILAFAKAKSELVVNEFQDQPGYCDLTFREHAKAYAAVVGHSTPCSALLHGACKGMIDPDAARRLSNMPMKFNGYWRT